jgi:hypothetical protein
VAGDKEEFPPLLPLGYHPMSIGGLRRLCVDRFPHSITRPRIMSGLEDIVQHLNGSGMRADLWINGSFTTEKVNPEDVDLVARMMGSDWIKATPSQKSALQRLNTNNFIDSHRCDTYAFVEYETAQGMGERGEWDKAYWLRQFGFSRGDEPKGLAVIKLPFLIT